MADGGRSSSTGRAVLRELRHRGRDVISALSLPRRLKSRNPAAQMPDLALALRTSEFQKCARFSSGVEKIMGEGEAPPVPYVGATESPLENPAIRPIGRTPPPPLCCCN